MAARKPAVAEQAVAEPAADPDERTEARELWADVELKWLRRMQRALSPWATDADRSFALRILGPLVVKDLQTREESAEEQEAREMLERVMRAVREG